MARPTNKQKSPALSRMVWAEIAKNMYINDMKYSDFAPLLGFSDDQPLQNRAKDPDLLKVCEVDMICRAMGLHAEIVITQD